ncbi:MAG: type III-B CRISPR module RAMP protein Cmr6 [Bacillota bacterium]
MERLACRKAISVVWQSKDIKVDNPGLALARYLTRHAGQQEKRQGHRPEVALIRDVVGSIVNEAYRAAFGRWCRTVPSEGFYVLRFMGTATSPLAIGLGNESPLEVGLKLNHTYGVPVIPGSALKGLCRRTARLLLDNGTLTKEQFDVIFGKVEEKNDSQIAREKSAASYIVFWDAWFDPDSAGGRPFWQDVVTVHHPEYYRTEGKKWPTDFDDPNPVPFVIVRPGSRFLFTISAPDATWASFVASLMKWGLLELGIGGKTNAGYGRFDNKWHEFATATETEQVLYGCKVERKVVRGALLVTISTGDEEIRVNQREWQPLEDSLPSGKKDQLRKKGVMHADVVIKRDKSGVHVLSVTPL